MSKSSTPSRSITLLHNVCDTTGSVVQLQQFGALGHVFAASTREVARKRDAPLWMPGRLALVGRRTLEAVEFFVADIDGMSRSQRLLQERRLSALGLGYLIHTTWEVAHYRLVVALSRPVAAARWPRTRAAIIDMIGCDADEHGHDASRAYFMPSYERGSGHACVIDQRSGRPIDVDSLQIRDGDDNSDHDGDRDDDDGRDHDDGDDDDHEVPDSRRDIMAELESWHAASDDTDGGSR